jgi:hypothetical protein
MADAFACIGTPALNDQANKWRQNFFFESRICCDKWDELGLKQGR